MLVDPFPCHSNHQIQNKASKNRIQGLQSNRLLSSIEDKNRKILEELHKKQQLLKKQTSDVKSSNPVDDQSVKGDPVGLVGSQSASNRERVALAHALTNSFGFFISQDSAFGNLVLPVLPRVVPSPPPS